MRKLINYLDPRYLKNRITYTVLKHILLSGSSEDDNAFQRKIKQEELLQPKAKRWEVCDLPSGVATEHSEMPGLWFIPKVLNESEVMEIRELLKYVTSGDSVQGEGGTPYRSEGQQQKFLEWYEYLSGRWMLPLQPYPNVDPLIANTVLSSLHSANCTNPQSWPNLKALQDDKGNMEQGIDIQTYAKHVIKIQKTIQQLIPDARGEPCLLIQMQRLERGIKIGKHIDDLSKGGKVISTAVLQGENTIRVGNIEFTVAPGDIYALARNARYDVKHEVLPFYTDRLSATIRFGVHEDNLDA